MLKYMFIVILMIIVYFSQSWLISIMIHSLPASSVILYRKSSRRSRSASRSGVLKHQQFPLQGQLISADLFILKPDKCHYWGVSPSGLPLQNIYRFWVASILRIPCFVNSDSEDSTNIVGGDWNHGILWLSIDWECHHPNWRTHIFQRGWNHQPVYVY